MLKEYEIAKDHFEIDTKDHVLDIKLDQGLYRDLVFGTPGSSSYMVRVTTWPGHLAISGDMGCFVFSRANMFELFRSDHIKEGYWASKCIAGEKSEYKEELWALTIKDIIDNYTDYEDSSGNLETLLLETPDDLDHAMTILDLHNVPNYWEYAENLIGYTYHFIWCLHAIMHTVRLYDEAKTNKGSEL